MKHPVPALTHVIRTTSGGALALALSLPALTPCYAQNSPPNGQTSASAGVAEAGAPLSHLLGPWIRNELLSEDPVLKTEGMWPGPDSASRLMRKHAEHAARQLDVLSIRLTDETLVLLDDRGDTARYPVEGKFHGRGVSGRVARAGGRLTIETVGLDWQRIETFYRQGNQLVLINELRDRRRRSVKFRTVYDRPGTVSEPDLARGTRDLANRAAIRIVPPQRRHRELLSGRIEIQTLIIDPLIVAVDFLIDGQFVRRVGKPPFVTHLRLEDPPREQILEVRAWDTLGEFAGSDRMMLNRIDLPFSVRIREIRGIETDGGDAVRVEAAVSVPRTARLERVDFYRGEERAKSIQQFEHQAPPDAARVVSVDASIQYAPEDTFVRVTAALADGRSLEDAELIQGANYRSEIDVQLVQLQVLVVDRDGDPVGGLKPEDFEIRESGGRRRTDSLLGARDVPLTLGLAIDSSDSMLRIWRELKDVAASFVDATLAADDRAFLVDFDDTVSLRQPLTPDRTLLLRGIDQLIPYGGTAINDGLLFSLLQFGREPGRRALVVITDGADEHSRSRPEQAADYAARLGLPIYFIELDPTVTWTERRGLRVITRYPAWRQKARRRLERISRQTGGRLFHVPLTSDDPPWTDRVEAVFDRIEEDLRNQHVLTYYSDRPRGAAVEPEVRVTRRGLKLRSAVPLVAIE